ncbi:MAG: DUF6600 domain-containing protein [Candidatus Baltobacteraceae bacterium]
MTSKWFTSLVSVAALVGMTLTNALPAAAQDTAPDQNGPGVARISVLHGSATVQRGDSNTQVAAALNAPLLPGDYISTGSTTRAELQFDGYTAVRLAGNVQARITSNDPNGRQMQLADGTIELAMVQNAAQFQIDTPSITVRAQAAGDYRVTIYQDGSTWVTARRGQVSVVTPQQTYTLDTGRTLVARGSASGPSIAYRAALADDSFDNFNAERDQAMVTAMNANSNLNPGIAGYDNLGAYGQWQDVAGYGQVWVPTQSAGWAPYRNGSWTWAGGYGWTWVGSEPWGWVPYHYGRWFYANGLGWAWYPPAYSVAPVWSPALVGFFGFGAGGPGWGVSVGFGFPNIGWCPLAPFAPFYPWYPGWAWTGWGWGWHPYWGGTRVVHVTNITNIYNNFHHGGGSGTLVGNFQHGNFTHTISVDPNHVTHIGTIHGAVPVTPTSGSLRFNGKSAAPVTFSKAFEQPRFASNRALAARTPFEDQQRAVSQVIHGSTSNTNAPVSHDNAPATTHATIGAGRDSSGTIHESTNASASSFHGESASAFHSSTGNDPWQRFNQDRGSSQLRGMDSRPSGGLSATGGASHNDAMRGSNAPTSSWSRFSNQRGNVAAPVSSGQHGTAYGRNPYGSSSRGDSSYPSYSRGSSASYPSYAHGDQYSHGGSYPSYPRGSYGSYGSNGSYPRGGGYPSSSRGGYPSAPHPSGGGGGGGGSRGGGGRPPH